MKYLFKVFKQFQEHKNKSSYKVDKKIFDHKKIKKIDTSWKDLIIRTLFLN